jgi:chromosome segregation ATPase
MTRRITLLIISFMVLFACQKTDMSIMHKLNAFRPELSEAGRQLSALEGKLLLTQERYHKDWDQVKQFLDQIPDSLRNEDYVRSRENYKKMMPERDSIHKAYTLLKAKYESEVTAFGKWETEARNGSVDKSQVTAKLPEYEKSCKAFRDQTQALSERLNATLVIHNHSLKDINERIGRFDNLDIEWK